MRPWYLSVVTFFCLVFLTLRVASHYGGEVVVGILDEPATLDPFHLEVGTVARDLSCALHVYPFLLGPDGTFIPDAAKAWEFPNNSTIIFYLHEDIYFHHGSNLTADDFIYTLQINMDSSSGSTWYQDLRGRIAYVEKIDTYKVKVGLANPYGPILYSFLFPIVPKDAYEERGEDFAVHPLGAGPFLFKEWVPNQHLILEAYEDFYDGRPYLDRIIFLVGDYENALSSFLNEELDILDVRTVDLHLLEDNPNLGVMRRPGNSWYYLGINQTEGPLAHQKVRQAISYAIDRQEIIKKMFWGEMIPAIGPIVPSSWAYNSKLDPYEYNPARAVRLLGEAGFLEGFSLELKCSPNAVSYMELVKKQLALVGIEVEIISLPWDLLGEHVYNNNFQLHYRAWIGQTDPERGINRQFMQNNNINIAGYSNPLLDDLAQRAMTTLDLETRKDYYFQIQEILSQDLPVIFLWYDYHRSAYHKRIQDFHLDPFYSYRTFRHIWVTP